MLKNKTIGILCVSTVAALLMTAMISASSADTPVADAARKGDLAAVKSLLKQGADVNAAQGDGMTALHWAVFSDSVELAKTLLTAGANLSAATRINGMTPLFFAAQNGRAPMMDLLLKAGARPNAPLSTGVTPLMIAARSGDADTVKLLLDNGADANATENARGETALMFAAASNRAAAVRVLIQHGANPSATTKVVDVAARNAAARGAGGGRGAAPPQAAPTGQPPAGGRGRGGGGNNVGNMDEERPPLVDYMGGMTPLLLAARQGHLDAVQALLDSGVKINEVSAGDKTSPLLIATINGQYDLAKFLLDRGADPSLTSTAGATPLYTTMNVKWAPKSDYPQPDTRQQKVTHLELMSALLDRGADPNARIKIELWYSGYNFDLSGVNAAGATPLWRAAQANDVPAMRLLVSRGADPLLKTTEGVSPLHVAAGAGVHGNDEVTATGSWMPGVRYLIEELKADVNDPDGKGLTALHHAAARGDNDMVLFLVSNGADPSVVAKNGQTVIDVANGPRQRIQPFRDTISLLSLLGARNSHKCVSC